VGVVAVFGDDIPGHRVLPCPQHRGRHDGKRSLNRIWINLGELTVVLAAGTELWIAA
jgi:hypothetical protein